MRDEAYYLNLARATVHGLTEGQYEATAKLAFRYEQDGNGETADRPFGVWHAVPPNGGMAGTKCCCARCNPDRGRMV